MNPGIGRRILNCAFNPCTELLPIFAKAVSASLKELEIRDVIPFKRWNAFLHENVPGMDVIHALLPNYTPALIHQKEYDYPIESTNTVSINCRSEIIERMSAVYVEDFLDGEILSFKLL